MHSSPLMQALLQAPDRPRGDAARPDEEFFVFRVGELTLAVRSKHVRDVSRIAALTPLPRAPSFVLGVVGQRGQVVPVVDLLRFLQQGEGRVSARSRMFISDAGTSAVAFLADSVVGLRRIFVADVLPAPMGGTVSHEFMVGITQSSEFGTLSLLDLPRIIASAHQRVSSR